MPYAVNAVDLIKYVPLSGLPTPIFLLLQPVLTQDRVYCEAGRIDGTALRVREDCPHERMEAILKIIREGAGQLKPIPKHLLRIYYSKTGRGSWKRV